MKTKLRSAAAILAGTILFSTKLFAADFEIKNEAEFRKCIPADSNVKKIADGMRFLEGPVWRNEGIGALVFSDIPGNELKQWSEKQGVITYRKPSNNANGNTFDRDDRLLTCEHSGRRVAIEEHNIVRTLVDSYEGKKLNSPNDIVVKSDRTVWFTDPDYGLGKRTKEQAGNFVYRFDPDTQQITAVAKDFVQPNGLCFSPDEKKLYIADSGAPRHIRVFDVEKDGTLKNGKVFCAIEKGVPDGIRCDAKGRIWSSAGDGISIFATDGTLIGKILTPESPANLCFGGRRGKTLYITAQTSLYSIETAVRGAR